MSYIEYLKENFPSEGSDDVSTLVNRQMIPLTTKTIKKLSGGKIPRKKVWHLTESGYLKNLFKIQGTKKQISTFTIVRDGSSLLNPNVLITPEVIVDLTADILIAAPGDIYTDVDTSGRRWVAFNYLKKTVDLIPNSDILKKELTDLHKKVKKQSTKFQKAILKEDRKIREKTSHIPLRRKLRKAASAKWVKKYIDEVTKIISDPEVSFFFLKLLAGIKVTQKTMKRRIDEKVANNIKIEKIYVLADSAAVGHLTKERIQNDLGSKDIPIIMSDYDEVYKLIKKRFSKQRFKF